MRIANPSVDCECDEDASNHQNKLGNEETDAPIEQAVSQPAK
jgi:hypothetical protein